MTAFTKVFVPGDTSACSVQADAVASAIASHCALQGIPITIVRTGSRGAAWMEPLVEIDAPSGRYGFANVQPTDIPSLFSNGVPAQDHPRSLGVVADHPWFALQYRLTFRRAGIIDPLALNEYRAFGGLAGLTRALSLSSEQIVHDLTESGLRGRGGAAFPAGIKWNTVRQAPGTTKYVVCNADEGDSGTFADRLLIESDPFQLIEGMIIAGMAVGATQGIVYLRSEYPRAIRIFEQALAVAYDAGLLGPSVLHSGHRFDITLRSGAGAYICGEETALLESLEGKRGVVRAKPPLPALSGLFGCPTVINNVLTLAAVSDVLTMTGREYAALGHGRSTGTMPFQLGGNVARGGLVEIPFGVSLRTLLEDVGGGTLTGRPMHAVQVGGPLGAYLPSSQWDIPLTYEHLAEVGAMLGHGGIVVFDDTVDMAEQAQFAMEFCAHESCGKCTPCRIGSTRGVEVIAKLRRGEAPRAHWQLLEELCETMELGSLCAMGGLTPMPVRSVMRHFPSALLSSTSRKTTGNKA